MTDVKVYRAIVRFINENKYSPSYKELCELTGFASTSTVYRAVQRLEKKGYIVRVAKWGNRGILLAKAHPDCDVVEVRHGHWIDINAKYNYEKGMDLRCSLCDNRASIFVGGRGDWWDHSKPPFCPNCGAKMDEEVVTDA